MIQIFTDLSEDLNTSRKKTGFHFKYNKVSAGLKMKMTNMDITYQLVPPINHRTNNSERAIQTFKNHFIAGLYNVDEYSRLKLWEKLLHQVMISLNFLRQPRVLPHL